MSGGSRMKEARPTTEKKELENRILEKYGQRLYYNSLDNHIVS
jgi:hypothetical protein